MAAASDEAAHKSISTSCHGFASALHKELSKENGNIVSSPLSIHMILSLLAQGADGSTFDELREGLFYIEEKPLTAGFQSMVSALNDIDNVTLHIANAIYVQTGFQLNIPFMFMAKDIFNCPVISLDFTNNVNAAATVNEWVKTSTGDSISDIVSSGDFDEFTKLLLINAVYFKGRWMHEFNPKNTKKRTFHVSSTQQKLVPTMQNKAIYSHGDLLELRSKFIEIPYLNEDIAMVIILPDELNGLDFLESNFNWNTLLKVSRTFEELQLRLPKFKFEATTNLKDILCKLGMKTMFEDTADFRSLSEEPLKVSKVVHKAIIEVSEEGTEAAAATVVHMRLKRMAMESTEEFTVDRPFMFIIEHRPNKLPLFVGSVRDIGEIQKDEL